jgi:hypothetical protein
MCPRYFASQGTKYGARTEVFAFGVTLLEVLLGRRNQDVPGGIFERYVRRNGRRSSLGGRAPAAAGAAAAGAAGAAAAHRNDSDDDSDDDSEDDAASSALHLTVAVLDARAGAWPESLAEQLLDLGRSCAAAERRDRPKDMLSVLRVLKDLERRFCEVTQEETRQRVAALQVLAADVVAARRAELQQKEREEVAARVAALAALRQCVVCFDECPLSAGVSCGEQDGGGGNGGNSGGNGGGNGGGDGGGVAGNSGGGGAPPPDAAFPAHFVCDDCFAQFVLSESRKDLHDVEARGGRVYCPAAGAGGCSRTTPLADQVVAAHVPGPVFAAFLQAQARLTEKALAASFDARLEAERKRIMAMTEEQFKVG